MSGSTGAIRIKSREDFKEFIASYTKIISKFPGFVSINPSGSYNSDVSKTSFGDIDLIVHIDSSEDKHKVKKDLQAFFEKMSDSVIVPFSSDKYIGKRTMNTGEIVTIRYHDKKLNYSVQVDNIIALSHTEAIFKRRFLDYPAEKQGLILGLVKVASIEEPIIAIFKRLHINAKDILPLDQEYEFNLSGVEFQLRRVTYEHNTFKQINREVIWVSKDFNDIQILLNKYNLDLSFEDLIKQAKSQLKNPRSSFRMKGVFNSMISIKSGERNTPKGDNKQIAIDKVNTIFGESTLLSFINYMKEFK